MRARKPGQTRKLSHNGCGSRSILCRLLRYLLAKWYNHVNGGNAASRWVKKRSMCMVEITPGIVVDPAVRFGKPVIQGTRIPVALVLE